MKCFKNEEISAVLDIFTNTLNIENPTSLIPFYK
jgi:hypothetical protein